jgi:hypothetical protein
MVRRLRDEENVLFGSTVKIMKCSCCLLSSLAVNIEKNDHMAKPTRGVVVNCFSY